MNQVDIRDSPRSRRFLFPFSKRGDRASERANERASGGQKMGRSLACGGRRISGCRLSPAKITSVAKWGRDEQKKKGGGKQGVGGGEESIHFLPHPLSLLLILSLHQRLNQRESSIPHPVLKIGSHASTNDIKQPHLCAIQCRIANINVVGRLSLLYWVSFTERLNGRMKS